MASGRLNKCGSCVLKTVANWRKLGKRNSKEEARKYALARPGAKNASRRKSEAKRRNPKARLNGANEWIIKEIYDLALLRTKLTGISWVVDHIVPLNGKTVCGLHVENNLQVVPANWNNKKGNKFDGLPTTYFPTGY